MGCNQSSASKPSANLGNEITEHIAIRDDFGSRINEDDPYEYDVTNVFKDSQNSWYAPINKNEHTPWIIFDTHGHKIQHIWIEFDYYDDGCKNIDIYHMNTLESKSSELLFNYVCKENSKGYQTITFPKEDDLLHKQHKRLIKLQFNELCTDEYEWGQFTIKNIRFYGTITENILDNKLYYKWEEMKSQNDNDFKENEDVINIKTWLCAKDKLISTLYKLFELGYSMNGININNNIHNIHYIIQSMHYVKHNQQLYEFGIQIIQHMIMRNNYFDQKTALYYAIDSQVYELVILFVENGSNLYHTNIYKESPLEYAIQKCKLSSPLESETKYNSPFPNASHRPSYNDAYAPQENNCIQTQSDNNNNHTLVDYDENQDLKDTQDDTQDDTQENTKNDIPPNLLQKTIKYLSEDIGNVEDYSTDINTQI
eukprot:505864_1